MVQDELGGVWVRPDVELAPFNVRRKELPQVAAVIDSVPHKLDAGRYAVFGRKFRELEIGAAGRACREFTTITLEDGVRVQRQHILAAVEFRHGRKVGRLVIDHRKHPVSVVLELPDGVRLRAGHVVLPTALVHAEQVIAEDHTEFMAELVQRSEGIGAQRLRPAGVESNLDAGLHLEPADHVHHALERAVRLQQRVPGPAFLQPEPHDVRAPPFRDGKLLQQVFNMVLVDLDVIHVKGREVPGTVYRVVPEQHMPDQVTHIDDGPVDVEQDQQRVFRIAAPHLVIVLRQHMHPVAQIIPRGLRPEI